MQPRTTKLLDEGGFARIAGRIRAEANISQRQSRERPFVPELPLEIGFQLTNRCNLRCKTCFQWNESGFHRAFPDDIRNGDLSLDIIERVFAETAPAKSTVYLWGGEPLVYREWDELVGLLTRDPRRVLICTNGLRLPDKLPNMAAISDDMVCLVSIDGMQESNDAIRGKNTFRKACSAVKDVVAMKRSGSYRGEIAVSCVIHDALVPELYEFIAYFESIGVDSVYLVFPWYIPDITAARMNTYFDDNFSWLLDQNPELGPHHVNSWHSYNFHLTPDGVTALRLQILRIMKKEWATRVRFQPELRMDEIASFIEGSEQPAQGRSRCVSVLTRMNVMPDGRVTTCKLFPEFVVGDLRINTVREVWRGVLAGRAREQFAKGLMPICSKCVQLYLHDA